jgi:beta-galactosidase/beta-glucuronidase
MDGPQDADATGWQGRIVVPFAWETEASTVCRDWLETGWYRRVIQVPDQWRGQHLVLCFGAAHHTATVWVNGLRVGEHTGGATPFEFDITAAAGIDDIELVVRVHAPQDKRGIVHGKQRSIPRDDYDGVAFTPTSGIWQTVWLEPRPQTHIAAVSLRPGDQLDCINATVTVAGPNAGNALVRLQLPGAKAVEAHWDGGRWSATLPVGSPRLWSPDDPHLYPVETELTSDDGADVVSSYTGLRRIEIDGNRILLNGQTLYLRGVLDQGYWPQTGQTPPSAQALREDIELARRFGYNCVRKHLKLEDPRWLYWADALGMLVWAEPPCISRFRPDAVAEFEAQIPAMVERDGNHPSIVVWGLYNEEWGLDWDIPGDPAKQETVRRAYDELAALDRTRPIVDNSGWTHVRTDLLDWHLYDEDPSSWARTTQGLVDGTRDRFPVRVGPDVVVDKRLLATTNAHVDVPFVNSEYGGGVTSLERAWHLRWQTQEMRRHDRIAGHVYTELYDVEHEMAGLVSYDRHAKDLGGLEPADVNAPTVLVLDVHPVQAGTDLIVTDDIVHVPVRISHHGSEPITGRLHAAWVPAMAPYPSTLPATEVTSELVTAKPYQVTGAMTLSCAIPEGATSARLLIWFGAAEGVAARTFLDVSQP